MVDREGLCNFMVVVIVIIINHLLLRFDVSLRTQD